jgi:hypothetical protein
MDGPEKDGDNTCNQERAKKRVLYSPMIVPTWPIVLIKLSAAGVMGVGIIWKSNATSMGTNTIPVQTYRLMFVCNKFGCHSFGCANHTCKKWW